MLRALIVLFLFLYTPNGRVVAQSFTSPSKTPTLHPPPTSILTPEPMVTPAPTATVMSIQAMTPTPSEHQNVDKAGITNGLSVAQLVVQILELVAIVVTLRLMHQQHRKDLEQVRLQLNQNVRHKAVELSIERNLQHLRESDHLPTDLAYWRGLSDEQKRWRVYLLNHLNLLYLVYEDYERELVDKEDLQSWKEKTTWILGAICKEESPHLTEVRGVLQQLLRREEGVGSPKFRRWLKEERVVPPDLFPSVEG